MTAREYVPHEPRRIRLKRTKGWRIPDGAVHVGRPTKWGNPFLLSDVSERYPSLTHEQCHGFVVSEFRDLMRSERMRLAHGYPSPAMVQQELAGKDLACWCPLDRPCHADVLLELANA